MNSGQSTRTVPPAIDAANVAWLRAAVSSVTPSQCAFATVSSESSGEPGALPPSSAMEVSHDAPVNNRSRGSRIRGDGMSNFDSWYARNIGRCTGVKQDRVVGSGIDFMTREGNG